MSLSLSASLRIAHSRTVAQNWNCTNAIILRSGLTTTMPHSRANLRLKDMLKPSSLHFVSCRAFATARQKLKEGPGLGFFIAKSAPSMMNEGASSSTDYVPYINDEDIKGNGRKVFYETYGCQMNVSDMEIVRAVLQSSGYTEATQLQEADVVLLMTCAIRDGAEHKIWNRLRHIARVKRTVTGRVDVAVLGCMAERLKTSLLEHSQLVDVVAGPDSYRDLPRLLAITRQGQSAGWPLPDKDNLQGVKEVTLLGQNVNSYRDLAESSSADSAMAEGFSTVYKSKSGGAQFADLLHAVAAVDPEMRIRFTSPHPKDFSDKVLTAIAEHPNICKQVHMPAQSGNDSVLHSMGRGYTAHSYLQLVQHMRHHLPGNPYKCAGVALSSDFIAGFCGESEAAHKDTLQLMRTVRYHVAYCFAYSLRERTRAHRRLQDDVPESVKRIRAQELYDTYQPIAAHLNQSMHGSEQLVLVENISKRNANEWQGRTDSGVKVILPHCDVLDADCSALAHTPIVPGSYIRTKVLSSTSHTLRGQPIAHSSICEFAQ